ncbi:hypothetical protein H6G81_32335 [Scytonema hofmannii FACHB-248]|uniref:Uncharacterized protein n=1 Tax=Scytonema hofmannii FACHB-248 TaxID=1842502 RepID=A0ABR8H1F6_9CYAN|nr:MULTISPECIES: hypothetical protein [Nostocales]MBD2609081.1 hypothetical protein [Scytonema hofmannii FACHB-248]
MEPVVKNTFLTRLQSVQAELRAIADHNFRPTFGDLAKVGVGGYLGQMLPEASKRSGDSV